jgi:cytochrome P450
VIPAIGLVHADSDVYDDAQRFRPERMLGASLSPSTWLPFGGGNRRCLGANLALTELRIVLREVLRRTDLATTTAKSEKPRVSGVIQQPRRGAAIRISAKRPANA